MFQDEGDVAGTIRATPVLQAKEPATIPCIITGQAPITAAAAPMEAVDQDAAAAVPLAAEQGGLKRAFPSLESESDDDDDDEHADGKRRRLEGPAEDEAIDALLRG